MSTLSVRTIEASECSAISKSGISCVKQSPQSKFWAYHCFPSSKADVLRNSASAIATCAIVMASASSDSPL